VMSKSKAANRPPRTSCARRGPRDLEQQGRPSPGLSKGGMVIRLWGARLGKFPQARLYPHTTAFHEMSDAPSVGSQVCVPLHTWGMAGVASSTRPPTGEIYQCTGAGILSVLLR
jgi:hypothetical protein